MPAALFLPSKMRYPARPAMQTGRAICSLSCCSWHQSLLPSHFCQAVNVQTCAVQLDTLLNLSDGLALIA